jgi:hypothetical protein
MKQFFKIENKGGAYNTDEDIAEVQKPSKETKNKCAFFFLFWFCFVRTDEVFERRVALHVSRNMMLNTHINRPLL